MRFADNNFALVTDLIYVTFLASRKDCVPKGKTRNTLFWSGHLPAQVPGDQMFAPSRRKENV